MEENPIYKFMRENNLTQLDESSFIEKYSNPDEAKKIHGFMVDNNLTQLSDSDFYNKYFTTTQPVEQEVAVEAAPAPTQERQAFRPTYAPATLSSIQQDTGLGFEESDPTEPSKWEQSKNMLYNTWQGIKKAGLDLGVGVQMPKYKLEQYINEGVETIQDKLNIADETADMIKDILNLSGGSVQIDGRPQSVAETLAGPIGVSAELGSRTRYVKPALQAMKEGDAMGVAMGAVNGALGYVPSILVGVATGGWGFVPMFAGSGFADGAALKAELSDTDIKDILESGEADVFVPALIGGLAGYLEHRALGGLKELVTKKVLNEKGLNIAKDILFEGGRQGFINWIEGGLMHYNLEYAKNGDLVGAGEEMINWMLSEEGANAGIEAALGTIVTGGIGAGTQRMRQPTQMQETEEAPQSVSGIEQRELNGQPFIGKDGNFVYQGEQLDQSGAESLAKDLKAKYPNMDFAIKDNTDANDPLAEANFTIVASPAQKESYSLAGEQITREQAQEAIQKAESIADLEGLDIQNDQALMEELQLKAEELEVSKLAPKEVQEEVVSEEIATEEVTPEAPTISQQAGNEVTVRVAGENVSGTIQVDEGGKVTLETPQGRIYELDAETPFTEFVRPVTVSEQGEIEVNGEAFSEARIVVEDGQPKALLIREDGTTRAITNPRVVEEIEYQIVLANMEAMSDQEADNLYNQYEQQREAETATEEGVAQTDEGTAEDRQLQEAIEEIELIEQLALEELEQAETSAKLVEITPKGAKEPKVYLVRKSEDGTYEATLNGRKVKRQEVLDQLGQAYETETRNLTGRLQEQVNQLKQEVEERLFGKQQADETGQPTEDTTIEGESTPQEVEGDTRERQVQEQLEAVNTRTQFESVRNANTPQQIAIEYDKETQDLEGIDPKDVAISSVVSKVKRQSFVDNMDKSDITQMVAKSWFSRDGQSLDQLAQEASDISGLDIQPSDIGEFMKKYTSAESIRRPHGNPKLKDLQEKYIALTGKGLNIRTAKAQAEKARAEGDVQVRQPVTELDKRRENTWEQAIAEQYTQEEWNNLSYLEKAEYLNNYYQYPESYAPDDIRFMEQNNLQENPPTPVQFEEGYNDIDALADRGELEDYIEGRIKIDEQIAEEQAQPYDVMPVKKIDDFSLEESEEIQVLSSINNAKKLTKDEKTILYRQYKRGVMSANDVYKYTTIDPIKVSKGDIDKWGKVYLNKIRGKEVDAEYIPFEEISQQESKFEEGKPKISERPEMENPVYGVLINGEEKFIQRVEGNDFDQWHEVQKSKDGVWNAIEPFLGFNRKEALDALYNQSEQKPLTRKEQIEQAKKEVDENIKDVKDKFTKGGFDQMGAQFDFKKAMEGDKAFYDAVVKLVKSYVRLKGLQAAEIYSNIEKVVNRKLNPDDRKYLKGIIDEARKEIPKVNVMKETEGLTKDQQVKQGLEEILEAKKRDAEKKLQKEREKANQRVQKAKDKGKANLDEFKNIKKTMIEFLKMDLADIPASSFTRGEFQKLLTQIDKAKTDHTLNQAIDQAYNIFADAAKRQRVADARTKVKRAKTNIKQGKIGVLEPNSLIDQMLRIDPKFIPNNIFELYQGVVSELGARQTVLSLSEKGEINQSVMQVLDAVDMQENRAMELKDIYDAFEDKDKDFSKTISKMLKEDLITEQDAELMRLFKGDIIGKEISEPKPKDIEKAKQDASDAVAGINMPDGQYSNTEKAIIRTFKSLNDSDLNDMSYNELLRVAKIADNLNNGFIPHLAERMRQRIDGHRSAKAIMPVLSSYKGSWTNFISSFKAGLKNLKNPRATTTLKEKIRRNPLSYIDQILENFKNTDVYDNVFRKLAKGQANYENDINTYIETVRRAISELPKGDKKQFESRAKLMMLAIQREFESNPNQKGTNTAKAYLDATIDDRNSIYTKETKQTLQDIFNQYSDKNGELDSDKLYKALSPAEKKAYNSINELNRAMLRPKAMETSTLIRGNRVPIYENYIHLPLAVIGGKQNPTDVKNLQYGFQQTSTRAGSLTERTGKAHAIAFDFFANSTEGAKMTLLDYNMTPAVKEVNNTMSKLYTLAQNDKDIDTVKALDDVYNEVMTNVFGIQMSSTSLGEAVVQEMMRKGYQAVLGGVGRSSSEFLSNAMFAGIYKPTETIDGISVISKHDEVTLSRVVRNLNSAQSNRLYSNAGMTNKHIDFSKMDVKEVSRMTGYDRGVIERLFNTLKNNPAYEFTDQIQAFMVSKPDQLIGRPMFFGAFDQEFKNLTGKSPDYKKIAENNQEYMDANFDALEQATNFADDVMVEAVASANPIDGIVRNQVPPSKNAIYSWFKTFNGYMTRFPTYEYNSAVRAVHSLRNNGILNSQDAVRLLIALNVRLFTYSLMTGTLVKMAYNLILKSLFDYEPPEEDIDETVGNVLAKESLSALAMLAVNRNIGNVGKIPVNIALEMANKKYGEGITYEGKYDAFDNSIVYPIVPIDVERGQKSIAQSVIENTAGPLSPQVKTMFRTATALDRMMTSKKEETRDKYRHELLTRTPFEIAGNLGYIPAYKDLRAMQLQLMYNNVKQAEKATKDKNIDWSQYKKQ